MKAIRASAVFTPEGVLADHVVEVDEADRIVAVRPAGPGDPDPHDGLLIPGLVNAHLHLELSHLGLVHGPPNLLELTGLVAWVTGLMLRRRALRADEEPDERVVMAMQAAKLRAGGTAGVCDIANGGATAALLAGAGLSGVVQHELIGFDARRVSEAVQAAGEIGGEVLGDHARVVIRPSPHALYSTAPAVVRATVLGPRARSPEPGAEAARSTTGTHLDARRRPPASIHVAEDRAELRFLRDGTGPWAGFLDRLGVQWRWWTAPGLSPVQLLDQLGVLGPELLLVHGVHLSPHDRTLIARRGSALCLCPRSNRHIGGELPDVVALLQAGVRLCLGTDSLASSPDLDVLGEIPVLHAAFPGVSADVWLRMATEGGASALGLDHLGAIAPGRAPGLVLLDGVGSPDDLSAAAPSRRTWLHPAGVA